MSLQGQYAFVDRHNQPDLHGYVDLLDNRRPWTPLPGNLKNWSAGIRQQPSLSPDGTTLAYRSPQGELEVVTFPACTNRVLVAGADAQYPQWSRDGSEIFYLAQDGVSMM